MPKENQRLFLERNQSRRFFPDDVTFFFQEKVIGNLPRLPQFTKNWGEHPRNLQ